MVAEEESRLTAGDRARLARLHAASLPAAMFSRLGRPVLERYYRFLERSRREVLFVRRVGGRIAAAAVLSLDGGSLLRRFVVRHPVAFSWRVGLALADRTFRRQLRLFLAESLGGGAEAETLPEVLQIYSAPELRGGGMGSELMKRAEEHLARRGQPVITVRTLAHDNEPVLRFYRRLGYRPLRRAVFCGDEYVVLRKSIEGGGDGKWSARGRGLG